MRSGARRRGGSHVTTSSDVAVLVSEGADDNQLLRKSLPYKSI